MFKFMSTMFLTKLYNSFVKNLGQETANALVKYVDYKFEKDMQNKAQNFATKEELYNSKLSFKEDLYNAKVELKGDIHKTKVDLIKWIITLWIAQSIMIIGLYLKK